MTESSGILCPICKAAIEYNAVGQLPKYCPHCSADMDSDLITSVMKLAFVATPAVIGAIVAGVISNDKGFAIPITVLAVAAWTAIVYLVIITAILWGILRRKPAP
jgi:hypothetical protein